MKNAKIIDVTRSFVPIDPNSYPENMHGTEKEDHPESRVPVVPYMGENFLPTARGYRSFFGTNAKIDIDSLGDHEPNHVFIFQTETYKNILVALCDDGIYYKPAEVVGEWTVLQPLDSPASTAFYEWSHCIIKNKLYIYRNGEANYYIIDTDEGEVDDIIFTVVEPTFIDLTAQQGMFKVGGRLGFWDANNAISTSSADDLSDFTPAVLTGANVTTYNSVVGRISNILTHGKNLVIYASKSIVELEIAAGQTFALKARPVLIGAGCAYKRQVVAASPDTTHFCITGQGIYKIENGKEEVIVPEFFDHIKQYTSVPSYLAFLQGRYLCFEMLDAAALNGNALFSTGVVPPSTLVFEGGTPPSIEDTEDFTICDIVTGVAQGLTAEQEIDAQNAGVPAPGEGGRRAGTLLQPVWTCYLSSGNGPVDPIVWSKVPCGGARQDGANGGFFLPSPTGDGGKTSLWSTDGTNKTETAGDDVWTDGRWTADRFITYQSAIWEVNQRSMAAFLSELEDRTETAADVVQTNQTGCSADSDVVPCTIGRYPTEFEGPLFGYNSCSMWLTRAAVAAVDITNNITTTVSCESPVTAIVPYKFENIGGALQVTHGVTIQDPTDHVACGEALVQAWINLGLPGGPWTGQYEIETAVTSTANGTTEQATALVGRCFIWDNGVAYGYVTSVYAHWDADTDKVLTQTAVSPNPGGLPTLVQSYIAGHTDRRSVQVSNNVSEEVEDFGLVLETAWCEITHWKYTNDNGDTITIPATSCTNTTDMYPGRTDTPEERATDPTTEPGESFIDPANGNFCGLPYELSPINPIEWPDESVTYPAISFLLQDGSIAPRYPTIVGAFVYDLHLKKWGKLKTDYKLLLDYSPINDSSSAVVDFNTFGILAGVVKADGYIYIFDGEPTTSSLTWGKIGYYRAGMTNLEEVRVDFASVSTGTIIVDSSLDGSALADEFTDTTEFTGVRQAIAYPPYSGKWHNVTVTGKYDIVLIEVKGSQKGRF